MNTQNSSATKGDYRMQIWRTRYWLFIFLGLGLIARAAADVPRYEVEVIVFEHVGAAAGAKTWLQDAETIDSGDGDVAPGVAPDVAQAPELLDSRNHRLSDVENALSESQDYQPIAHIMWHQLAHPAQQAQSVVVTLPDGDQLTGTVRLFQSRYLHFEADLLYRKAAYDETTRVFRLKDRRRISTGELAYFDHPVFGVLVLATRLQRSGDQAQQEPIEEPADTIDAGPDKED